MAMEKLYELHDSGGFDLIVVDTPPTRHALDFLDAPRRLTRLLDNRVFRFLIVPTRSVVRLGSAAAQAFLRPIARVVGHEVIDDVIAFFRAFEGMEDGFRERAASVTDLLASPETSFVLVTSPRRDAVEEAEYFAEQLDDGKFAVEALIVNRVHPRYCDVSPTALQSQATALDASTHGTETDLDAERVAAAQRLAARYTNLAEFEDIAIRERREVAGLEQRLRGAAVAHVPELGYDVHDFTALRAVARHLMAPD
jgi:anion-transporting  ArsA/GET3 family ATPase